MDCSRCADNPDWQEAIITLRSAGLTFASLSMIRPEMIAHCHLADVMGLASSSCRQILEGKHIRPSLVFQLTLASLHKAEETIDYSKPATEAIDSSQQSWVSTGVPIIRPIIPDQPHWKGCVSWERAIQFHKVSVDGLQFPKLRRSSGQALPMQKPDV